MRCRHRRLLPTAFRARWAIFFLLPLILAAAGAGSLGKARASEGEGAGAQDELRYIDMKPVDVPLTRAGYLQGRFIVRAALKVETAKARAKVEAAMPKLEAAFLMAIADLTRYDIEAGAPIDIPLVRARLQRAADTVLGPGVTTVFIHEAMTSR
ncbi:MAG: hypothetical protein D6757_05860 [Alphaproteobacteria bacterium]|nr:MAG: hypothetical protein D6757_05860 [Alphaproteobacteria bacterium]